MTLNNYLKGVKQSYYYYEGSLTTPDCNETVNWLVLREVQECSKEQKTNMVAKMEGTYRYTQDLNNRTVYITEEPNEDSAGFPLMFILIICGAAILALGGVIVLCLRRRKEGLIDSNEGNNE